MIPCLQDEMITEEECEPDSGRSEAEEDLEESMQPDLTVVAPQQVRFTSSSLPS